MRIIPKKIWITALSLLIPYLFILIVCTYRTNYEAILPGGITKVEDFIELDTNNEELGSFNTVFVYTYPKTTLFQNFVINNDEETEKVSYDAYLHLDNAEINAMGQISKNVSIISAIVNAYSIAKENGHNVNLDVKFAGTKIYYRRSNHLFKIGDLITKINGVDYMSEGYNNAFVNQKVGDVFTLLRNNEEVNVTLTSDYFNGNYITYSYYHTYTIDYENAMPKITVNPTTTGGPSGGLLQTLALYNQITEFDYTYGKTIAGTGTMNLNGAVGGIGGIKEKIYTAYYNHVDIFFCPKVNYEEALIAYNKLPNKKRMNLISVESLKEAINYLEGLND